MVSSGDNSGQLYLDHEDLIAELVENSVANRTATLLSGSAIKGASGLTTALAFPLITDDGGTGAVVVLNATTPDGLFPAVEQDALMTLSTLTTVALRNVSLQDAQRNFFAHITDLLVAAMDTHIDGRKGHAMAVAQLSNRLAREVGLAEVRMQNLHFAALLHDIGMLKVDRAHQRSPGHFQKHPQTASRMLSRIRLWEDVAPIVLHHHEWFDGSGYPEARAGEDIPLESRIIAVADCYDALIRPGAHRMAMTNEAAVDEIIDHAGTQFDPTVTAALAALAGRDEIPAASH
ncbi:MAG: putative nucleotidyltransferase with HDIG domain [Myxococcota bacterium]|jgi:putative nucleotidyltransferase with HDIG domain